MEAILRSGELWGEPGPWGGPPRVKAYRGELAAGDVGFEFFTYAEPNLRGPVMYWTPRADGLVWEENDMAKLDVLVTKVSQVVG